MDEKTAWQQFVNTGAPAGYLAYVAAKQHPKEEEQRAIFHQRTHRQREQHRGE